MAVELPVRAQARLRRLAIEKAQEGRKSLGNHPALFADVLLSAVEGPVRPAKN